MKDCPQILDLLSTEELIQELQERFDHFVICGLRVCEHKGDRLTREWFGDEYVCRGMLAEADTSIHEDTTAYEEVEDDEDD